MTLARNAEPDGVVVIPYEKPTLTVLGTLSELTLGPAGGTDDAMGGGNGDGSVI